jgi:VanZ family protein
VVAGEIYSNVKYRSFYLLFYIFPAFAYGGIIFYLSSLSSLPEEVPSFWGFDKIIHFVEYFIFGFLVFRCFTGRRNDAEARRRSIMWTISIGVFYAMTDEWHQSFVPGRDPSVWDAFFDSLGVAFAAIAFQGIRTQVRIIRHAEDWLERRMKG